MNAQAVIQQLEGLLKIREAAEFLGVSPQTLRNWDDSGRLTPLRHPVTGYRFYRQKDLERFLKAASKKQSRNRQGKR